MSLRVAARPVARALAAARATPVAFQRRNCSVIEGKERAEEAIFMRREEERLLKSMMAKMREREHKGRKELDEILGSNRLPDDVIQKLLDWKYGV